MRHFQDVLHGFLNVNDFGLILDAQSNFED